MKVQVYVAALLLCCVGQSCNIINPAEKIPTYIRIDSIAVKTDNYGKTGTTTSKITSAWVYVNNSLVGAFDIPSNIPVLIDKASTISIAPGIDYSGLKNYQATYPFYTFDTFYVSPSNGKVLNHTAVVKYTDAAQFRWNGDFETGNKFQKVNAYKTEDTGIVRVTDVSKVFEGGASGYLYMNSVHPSSENISVEDITIAKGESYLEVNYKCNVDFVVGMQTTKNGDIVYEYFTGLKANETWKKAYIGLNNFTGKYSGAPYHIMIKSSLPDGQTDGYVLLDNLKVVSY